MAQRYEKTGKKGHGCFGTIAALLIVGCLVVVLLMFTTNLLDGTKNRVLEFFYPQKYSEYVTQYSSEYGVEESLIYAVIRTESGFRPEVESSAGAVGLMQLMPETFEWLQNSKDGGIILSQDDLLSPQVSVEYGTYLLSILTSKYENENTAVAAYNAGIATVDEWLSDTKYSSDGITLKNIPYSETSKYVDRVENTKSMYDSLYY